VLPLLKPPVGPGSSPCYELTPQVSCRQYGVSTRITTSIVSGIQHPVFWTSTDSRAPACLVTHAARSGAHCWALLAWLSASAFAKPQEDTLRAQPQPRYTLDNVAPVEPRSVARSLPVAAAVSVRDTPERASPHSWMMT
jgi:hypothetical protein